MSYTANTASLLPNAGPQAYLQYASPVESTSTTVTITFPPISQGLQALVSVNVPNGTGYQTFMVYLNGSVVGSMVGNNPFGPLNLNGGDIVSLSGPTVTGNGVMTGSIGPNGTLSLSPVVASGGTSGSVALTDVVTIANPAVGSELSYTYPSPLRLIGGSFLLTTNATAGERSVYLNQSTAGQTLSALLTPLALPPSAAVQLEFAEGMTFGSIQTRLSANGTCPSSQATVYTATTFMQNATMTFANGTQSSVECACYVNGSFLLLQVVGSAASVSVQLNLLPGDEVQAVGDGVGWAISGWGQATTFQAPIPTLLLPAGSSVSTSGIQSGDQISGAALFFTQN